MIFTNKGIKAEPEKHPFIIQAFFSLLASVIFSHVEIPFFFGIVENYRTYHELFMLNLSFIGSMFLFDVFVLFPISFIPGCILIFCRKKLRKPIKQHYAAAFTSACLFTILLAIQAISLNAAIIFIALYCIFERLFRKNTITAFIITNILVSISYFSAPKTYTEHIVFICCIIALLLITYIVTLLEKYRNAVIFLLVLLCLFEWNILYRWSGYLNSVYTDKNRPTYVVRHSTGKPNIILIVLDTLRADHIHHALNSETPNIAAFAKQSVVYTNCTSTTSWTLPAHSSIFTGLYPTTHGAHYLLSNKDLIKTYKYSRKNVKEVYYPLDDKNLTMAEILRKNGYSTYGIASNFLFANHVTGIAQGFDIFEDLSNPPFYSKFFQENLIKSHYLSKIAKLAAGITGFSEYILQYGNKRYRIAEDINKSVVKAIKSKKTKPMFLFVNYMDAHAPRIPPAKYRKQFSGTIKSAWFSKWDGIIYIPAWNGLMNGEKNLSKAEEEHIRASYKGGVMYLDSQVGELMRYLKEQKLYNNSMIILTSDHGEQLGEHNLVGHTCGLYKESISVPLIIKYPKSMSVQVGLFPKPVQIIDIMPTALKTVGINPPKYLEGSSLPGIAKYTKKHIISEQYEKLDFVKLFGASFTGMQRSITNFPYKYIWNSMHEDKLFNIEVDPKEMHNLIDTESNIAEQMSGELKRWVKSRKKTVNDPQARKIDKEEIKRLTSLGYL